MFSVGFKSATFVSTLIILAAYFYRRRDDAIHIDRVLAGLLEAENAVPLDSGIRVAVGFGSCVDVIGSAIDFLNDLKASVPENPQHFNTVRDQEEFEKIFAYFFRHGAAAE